MNGFWEVSLYERPFVSVAGVLLTFGESVGNDLPPTCEFPFVVQVK